MPIVDHFSVMQRQCVCFQVILIENKEESLVRAQSRSAELGLQNIGFIQANLDYFTGPFQIGVSIQWAILFVSILYLIWVPTIFRAIIIKGRTFK